VAADLWTDYIKKRAKSQEFTKRLEKWDKEYIMRDESEESVLVCG
jgi:hypothetical protein